MTETMRASGSIGRRGLILGVGTGTALAGGMDVPAHAVAVADHRDGVAASVQARGGTPITDTIASAPENGLVYRTVTMYDFFPFSPAAGKTWGGNGTYSSGTATTMRAILDVPPGAQVASVEYYIYNSSGSDFVPDTHLYVPGHGTIASIGASVNIPSTSTITATQVAPSQSGPYPDGARLLISCSTPSTGTIQINGARVGFRHGGGTVAQLGKPLELFHDRLRRGKVHTVTLPATLQAPGRTGVQLNLIAAGATKAGGVKVWPAGFPRPAEPALFFAKGGSGVANALTVPAAPDGAYHFLASQSVNLTVVVLGTVS
jgi:hypothetical protein